MHRFRGQTDHWYRRNRYSRCHGAPDSTIAAGESSTLIVTITPTQSGASRRSPKIFDRDFCNRNLSMSSARGEAALDCGVSAPLFPSLRSMQGSR